MTPITADSNDDTAICVYQHPANVWIASRSKRHYASQEELLLVHSKRQVAVNYGYHVAALTGEYITVDEEGD